MEKLPLLSAALLIVVATAILPNAHAQQRRLIEHGRYIVKLGGCNDCHTPGYAERAGKVPEKAWLTGSPLGYRGAWGTTYASNLRPHFQSMTAEQWVRYARSIQTRPPMPWFVLHDMSDGDLRAVHAFVSSLGPAPGTPSQYLPPGQAPKPPYVSFPMPEAQR